MFGNRRLMHQQEPYSPQFGEALMSIYETNSKAMRSLERDCDEKLTSLENQLMAHNDRNGFSQLL